LPPYCVSCDYRFACNGGCPKHRFTHTPQGDPGLNYLCPGYKMFFSHTAPYMRFMANELRQCRPADSVMGWARQMDAEKAAAIAKHKPSRNEPCPCGSGQKYKKCCARRA
jgi:uncharacterized protein